MKDGPDITRIAALIGDPARANMLNALMSGKALTATELSHEAGVTLQTASSHLKKLSEGGLISLKQQGRHRYFRLANDQVAQAIETLSGLAAGSGHLRTRTGPKDFELRKARVCYNHLAGHLGTQMYESFIDRGFLTIARTGLGLTPSGTAQMRSFGIDLTALSQKKAPLCRECLDWSERRSHLAGSLGRALLAEFESKGWASRVAGSRIIRFSQRGEAAFQNWLTD